MQKVKLENKNKTINVKGQSSKFKISTNDKCQKPWFRILIFEFWIYFGL